MTAKSTTPESVAVVYTGNPGGADVAFPTRAVFFPDGEPVDLTPAEAASLADHPEFTLASAVQEKE